MLFFRYTFAEMCKDENKIMKYVAFSDEFVVYTSSL
jgi:hypothetical protein